METKNNPNWSPLSETVQQDQRVAFDEMREECPVAHSPTLGWSVFRHAHIMRILHDHEIFSNDVSTHTSVPNGMDPPEHTPYRKLVEQYFSADQIAKFKPTCRDIASALVDQVADQKVEVIDAFARPFAVQVQCAFMGWPNQMQQPLRDWTESNLEAIRIQDRPRIKEVAEIFSQTMKSLLNEKRSAAVSGNKDVTSHLLEQTVNGRPLKDEEIISILRNWTMGEVGTITNAIGIILHFLATNREVQTQLRAGDMDLEDAIEEILRLHGPLVNNRRKTTCPVKIGGHEIDSGETISINWIAANRDPQAFDNPCTFHPDRNQKQNLLYGAGIHACPAAPLARMELRVLFEELLSKTKSISIARGSSPVTTQYPENGYSYLCMQIH